MTEPYDTIDELRMLNHKNAQHIERLRLLAARYPACPELWDFLGDQMQLCEDAEYPIEASLECYQKAIAADPEYAEAYESLGYAYDTYFDDFIQAETCFRKAIEIGAGDSSLLGLARVLAQAGRVNEANAVLDSCLDQDGKNCISLRKEIDQGFWGNNE